MLNDHVVTDEGEKLYPLFDSIIFKFCMDLTKSTFRPTTKSGIIISDVSDYEEHTRPQWGEILACGPDVSDEIRNATYVLLEAYGWTNRVRLNGPFGNCFWKSEERLVMAVSDEYLNPY